MAPMDPVTHDPDVRCEACGRFGAYEIGGRALCEECLQLCGSCCPEFARPDRRAEEREGARDSQGRSD